MSAVHELSERSQALTAYLHKEPFSDPYTENIGSCRPGDAVRSLPKRAMKGPGTVERQDVHVPLTHARDDESLTDAGVGGTQVWWGLNS
jgi:hypothetical protein